MAARNDTASNTIDQTQTRTRAMARKLQKVEQVGAGTAREVSKLVDQEMTEADSQAHRVERSNYHSNQKGLRLKKE